MQTPTCAAATVPHEPSAAPAGRALRLHGSAVLAWAFAVLNTARLLSYLPTMWLIATGHDASQHSLWTWGTWFGANLTMGLWLLEQQGRRWTGPVVVNLLNAAMCAATAALIVAQRC